MTATQERLRAAKTSHKFDPECKRPKSAFYQWFDLHHQLRQEDLTPEEHDLISKQIKELSSAIYTCPVCKRIWPCKASNLIDHKYCCEQCRLNPEPIPRYRKKFKDEPDCRDSVDVLLRNAYE